MPLCFPEAVTKSHIMTKLILPKSSNSPEGEREASTRNTVYIPYPIQHNSEQDNNNLKYLI